MLAVHNLISRAEEQERSSSVGALGLTLLEAFIPNERTLLVADQATNRDAFQEPA